MNPQQEQITTENTRPTLDEDVLRKVIEEMETSNPYGFGKYSDEDATLLGLPSLGSLRLAHQLVKQWMGSPFIPKFIANSPNPAGTFVATIVRGNELGFKMMESLSSLYLSPDGRLGLYGTAMLALMRKSGLFEKMLFTELKDEDGIYGIEFYAKRKDGDDYTARFTHADALRAGLYKAGSNHEKYPQFMCKWRAVSDLFRTLASDLSGGPLYTREELEEDARLDKVIEATEARQAKAENPYVVAAKPAAEISPNAVNPAASANPESGNGGGAQSHQTAHSGGAGLVPDPPQAGREIPSKASGAKEGTEAGSGGPQSQGGQPVVVAKLPQSGDISRDAHGVLANGPLGGEPSTAEAEISAPTSAPVAETTGKATGSPARELDELAETEEQTAQREHVAAMRNTASPSPDKTQEPSKVVEMPKAAPASLITEIAGFLGPNADKVTKEFLRGYLQSPLKNSNPRMVEGLTVLLAASKTHSQRLIQDPYGMGVIAATGWKAFQKFIEKWPKDCKEMATAFVLIRYADTAGGDFVELLQGAPVFGETMDKDEVRGFLNVLACCEWGTATKLREKALESGIPLHVILSRVEHPWNDGKILGLLAFSNGESATAGPGPSEPTDEGVDEDDIGLLFQAMRGEKP